MLKIESMEEYSEAKIHKTKPELRNSVVNADYFYSSAEISNQFSDAQSLFKINHDMQIQMLADICAFTLEY